MIILDTFEKLLNQALLFDARTPGRLEKLAGKTIKIQITDLLIEFLIQFSKEGIHLSRSVLEGQNVISKGPCLAFVTLLLSKDPHLAARQGLVVEGDVELGAEMQQFFLGLRLDWEEMASRVLGDTVAHQLFESYQKFREKTQEMTDSFSYSLSDYLKEEARVLPTPMEVKHFLEEVDDLHMNVERLAVRLMLLEEKRRENNDKDSTKNKENNPSEDNG